LEKEASKENRYISIDHWRAYMGDKKLFLSTIKRGSKQHQITGCLFELHPSTLEVIKKLDIPEPSIKKGFWNPRGGNRGARGLTFYNGVVYVATATVIRKYDLNLNYLGEIKNKRLAGLHNIHADKHGIAALSTLHDLVVKVDYSGKTLWEWHGHRSKVLQKTFKFNARAIDFDVYNKGDKAMNRYLADDRLHLSGSCIHNNRLFVLSGKRGCIIEVCSPNKEKLYLHDKTLNAGHDIVWIKNLMYVNSTRNQSVRVYQGKKPVRTITSKIFNPNKKINQFSTAGWQRGLHKYDENTLLVGTSPLTVFLLDINTGKVRHRKTLDNDIKHSSYSLLMV
jgi:hypothetical protein